MPWWVRAYLLFAAVQGLGIGLTGMLVPAEMQIPLRITPLNARFVAALYIAGGVGVLLAAFSRRRAETRIMVIGFAVATTLILVLTLLNWSAFMDDALPHRPVWLFDYVADPVLGLLVIAFARLLPRGGGERNALSALFVAQTVLFGALAVVLFSAPDVAAAAWPWALPPLLGQLYACFFLTFAVGAALASAEPAWRPISAFLAASFSLAIGVLVASVLHLDRFKPEAVSVIWFGAFVVLAVVFGGALVGAQRWRWQVAGSD